MLPLIFLFFLCFPSFVIISLNVNDTNVDPAVPSSGIEETSQVVDTTAASDTLVTDIDIARGVPSWSIVEYDKRSEDTLNSRPFSAILPDKANLLTFDDSNVCFRKNICVWNWRWTFL